MPMRYRQRVAGGAHRDRLKIWRGLRSISPRAPEITFVGATIAVDGGIVYANPASKGTAGIRRSEALTIQHLSFRERLLAQARKPHSRW